MPRKLNLETAFSHHKEPDISGLQPDAVFARLNTTAAGLSDEQSSARLRRHGFNSITVEKKIPLSHRIFENFFHTMAILLWMAGIAAMIAKAPELAWAIWSVNLINGAFSIWQEFHAAKATEALRKLLPDNVRVIRCGRLISVSSKLLVPGDVLDLAEGDRISADARLVQSEGLKVDQSTLTGESRPISKNADPLQLEKLGATLDAANLVFAGTSVLTGHARAVVYATGTSSQFGHIARLTQTIAEQPSPLQKEMSRVTRRVTIMATSLGAIIFLAAVTFAGANLAQAFVFSMGMIVAFVPEGMLPTVTLALALAVQRMARRNALVKRLSSVETLGCTNVICTDKTGTLTQNQMTVVRATSGGHEYKFSGVGYDFAGTISGAVPAAGDENLKELLRAAVLCNNASIVCADGVCQINGDPTELALIVAGAKGGLFKEKELIAFPRLHEIPFDSRRKLMTTVHGCSPSAGRVAFVKGNPSVIVDHCSYHVTDAGVEALETARRQEIMKTINDYAADGLRVIAVANKLVDSVDEKDLESGLTFLGFFGMFDPPHTEVPAALEQCHAAGIQVVMITGDYEVTAEAIGRKVGLLKDGPLRVITGTQLDRISDQELVELIDAQVLFARVNPEHKLRVVQAFQRSGKIVAVTGDGVNDAPALKRADIGVAMGKGGTDVAREAADMILLDDNFASIVSAVEEGRAVYDNIKKFAVYVFNSNMAEAVPFVVMLLSCGLVPLPLTIMQVLSIDLGTDMMPAIGLGADAAEKGVMCKPPRLRSEPLLSKELLVKALLWYGSIESIAGLSGYFFHNYLNGWPGVALGSEGSQVWRGATTMTLACIVSAQVGAVFCCRSDNQSIFSSPLFGNKLIVCGVVFEIVLLGLLIYLTPLQKIFNTAPLPPVDLLFVVSWIPVIIGLDELRKLVLRSRTKLPTN